MDRQFLIVTDLDNTLLGDDTALETLNQKLSENRQKYGTKIVYATGRTPLSYQHIAQEKHLLKPDALIASVGTEIYYDPQQEPDPNWSEQISIGWDRDVIVSTSAHFSDLVLQPDSEQRPFKISYHLGKDLAYAVIPLLEAKLKEKNVEFQLIYSRKWDLDILPKYGNKGLAMQYLQKKWQIAPTNTVVSGDSGNDIALFSIGEERGIIVGNAQKELILWDELNPIDYHYQAKACYAGGILEGLYYFGWL
jgi:sucrose-6-phosphatase